MLLVGSFPYQPNRYSHRHRHRHRHRHLHRHHYPPRRRQHRANALRETQPRALGAGTPPQPHASGDRSSNRASPQHRTRRGPAGPPWHHRQLHQRPRC
ncbi:hypothetical protein CKO40_12600 [Halochromatium glycolicum]|uniref:Uncharacterized protein n=1 Tax=Halochromatium glycolicum TaxID=85075 RepID=A0AAJ0XAI1_9GAMM|nr:hypothetical protein [Halochromatium glycolicum]